VEKGGHSKRVGEKEGQEPVVGKEYDKKNLTACAVREELLPLHVKPITKVGSPGGRR